MKLQVLNALVLAVAIPLSFAAGQSVQADGILANDTGYLPTITVTDTHTEKAYRLQDKSWNTSSSERLTAKIVANLSQFDPSEIASDMTISVGIGNYNFYGTLTDLLPLDQNGNPVTFNPTMTSGTAYYWAAKLDRYGNEMQDKNGNTIMVKIGSVAFAWTATRLTITITITDTDRTYAGSPLNTLGLLGLADAGTGTKSISYANEELPVSVSFGTATGDRPIYAKGKTTTTHKTLTSDDYALNSATLTATADTKVPVIHLTLPADDGDNGAIDFDGTVTDLPPGTLPDSQSIPVIDVEAYVNDPDLASPTPADDVSDPDGTGKHTFSFTGLILDPGTNTVVLVATDDSGNQKVFTDTVVSTQVVAIQKRRK